MTEKESSLDGTGKRMRLCIAGENYYLIGTRNAVDNGIDFTVTIPDENRNAGINRRITAEKICEACSVLSRRV